MCQVFFVTILFPNYYNECKITIHGQSRFYTLFSIYLYTY